MSFQLVYRGLPLFPLYETREGAEDRIEVERKTMWTKREMYTIEEISDSEIYIVKGGA